MKLEEEVFRRIADFTYDWETWFGVDGKPRWINPAVARITGYGVEECLAMPSYPMPLIEAADASNIADVLAGAASGTSGNDVEFRIACRDQSIRWGAISWQSLVSDRGQPLGFRTSVRDITARKESEARLRDALYRAEAGERSRTELLASVSHELRTPIHNILGHVDLLSGLALPPRGQDYVTIIEEQAEFLLRHVDDLLDISSKGVTRATRQNVECTLSRVVEGVTSGQQPAFDHKGLALAVEIDNGETPFLADGFSLHRILRNLVDNARKFTDAGTVKITGRYEVLPSPEVRLCVSDTGCGFSNADLPNLRQPFVRGGQARTGPGGVGLGLAIVDQLCGQLGGRLDVDSTIGVGSTVTVSLPVESIERHHARLSTDAVLVVDDQSTSRRMVVEMLATLGVTADEASDAIHARDRCARLDYRFVLLDLHMPGSDGFEARKMILEVTKHPRPTPHIVLMSADVFGSAHVDALGFDGHLPKPVRREDLRRLLDRGNRHATVLDPTRIAELRGTLTREGETFLQHFGRRANVELHDLIGELERLGQGSEDSDWSCVVHRLKGTALLLGASHLGSSLEALDAETDDRERRRDVALREARRVWQAVSELLEAEDEAKGSGHSNPA